MRKVRIAILHRLDLPFNLSPSRALYAAMQKNKIFDWIPVLFTCRERSEKVMREQLEEVVAGKYDVIVTFGALYTSLARRIVKSAIPMVFVSVRDPVELDVINSLSRPGSNCTGVMHEHPPPVFVASLLVEVKRSMRSVLIPYYPGGDGNRSERDVRLIANFFAQKGVEVIPLPVESMENLVEQVRPYIDEIDTIFFLEGYPFPSEVASLSELCNEEQITLFVQDIDALQYGAGVVFGQDVSVFGEKAFDLIKKVVTSGKPAGEIPVTVIPNGRRFLVNESCARLQGVDPDPALEFCLRYGTLVKDDK